MAILRKGKVFVEEEHTQELVTVTGYEVNVTR